MTAMKASLSNASWAWLSTRLNYVPFIVVGLILVALPSFLPSYLQGIISKVLIFAIFAISLNLLNGYTGLFSLGHAAYFGAAAYTSGVLIVKLGIENFWIVAPTGILMATFIASIFGFIALRVSGIYFLFVTLALGQLLSYIAIKWASVTGGSDGLVITGYPYLGFSSFSMTATSFYYLVFIIFAISFFLLYRLIVSPFGVALQGIRESETRMRSMGYNTWLYKYIAFVIAGLFAGVAGVLFLYHVKVIIPTNLGVLTSTLVMLMVVSGSDRVFWGPCIGAVIIVLLEHYSSIYSPERWPLILGGFFIITVMFLRGGISIYWLKLWKRRKLLWKH